MQCFALSDMEAISHLDGIKAVSCIPTCGFSLLDRKLMLMGIHF